MTDGFRQESLQKFKSLPSEASEIFKYQTFFKDFEKEIGSKEMSGDLGIEVVSSHADVSIRPLTDGGSKNVLKKFDIDDRFVQMNNAFFNSGSIIEVPGGLDTGTIRISSSPKENIVSKLIIFAGENSRVDVVKESYSPDDLPRIISEDVLVIGGQDSRVTFSEFQNYNRNSTCFSNKITVSEKGASTSWNLGMFGGSKVRTRTYNFLEGDGSHAEDLQLTFGDGEQLFDAFSNLIHVGRSTTARALAKGAFTDRSNSIFKGMIKIRENAKNASSYLACHGMLLSKRAKANAIPGLEIETNDVKATHAASVSPIEEEKIFYLTSRGVPEDDARRMITLGFFEPLIKGISSEEIRAKIRYLIEAKWQGKKIESFESKMLKEFMEEDVAKPGDMFEGHYKYR